MKRSKRSESPPSFVVTPFEAFETFEWALDHGEIDREVSTAILDAEFPLTPVMKAYREQVRVDNDVAQKIWTLRRKTGLTQKQLADRIGTHQSVIPT